MTTSALETEASPGARTRQGRAARRRPVPLRGGRGQQHLDRADGGQHLVALISAIWGLVAVASIAAPSLVSGNDGTVVPIAAPMAGMPATAFAAAFIAGSPGERTSRPSD
jgi:hypothetical protein